MRRGGRGAGKMAGVVDNDSPGAVLEKVEKNKECPEYGTAERDLSTAEEEKSFRVLWRIQPASFNCNP